MPFVLLGGFVIAGDLRLHGGPHRRVEQPGVGRRHSRDRGLRRRCSSLVDAADCGRGTALVAFALFVTAIVFACATISNDNLQDLKTGQLVGASPRRQQIALIVGVDRGRGRDSADAQSARARVRVCRRGEHRRRLAAPLPAPQATLISALAQGVIGGNLNWTMIGIGALVGVVLIVVDDGLGAAKKLRFPPLAVGIGIYLPDVGDVRRRRRRRDRASVQQVRPRRRARRRARNGSASLIASGMIVGESLFGVLNAGLIVAFTNDAPIALVPETFAPANWLGVGLFVLSIGYLYRWMRTRAH